MGHAARKRGKERRLHGRASVSREVALLEVEDQPHIAYRKGAIAMYTLRERIGEARVNTALRRYLEKHRDGGPPYPASLDLYAELRDVTPDSLQYLLVHAGEHFGRLREGRAAVFEKQQRNNPGS